MQEMQVGSAVAKECRDAQYEMSIRRVTGRSQVLFRLKERRWKERR